MPAKLRIITIIGSSIAAGSAVLADDLEFFPEYPVEQTILPTEDGIYQQVGPFIFDEDGNYWQQLGPFTLGSDGSSCTKVGNTTYCTGN